MNADLLLEVDDLNRPVRGRPRADLDTAPFPHRVVHLLLFLPGRGHVLLQQIAPGRRHAGLWGSSAAGYVRFGETSEQAMRRIAARELGASEMDLSATMELTIPDRGVAKFLTLFLAAYNRFPLVPDDSSSAVCWWSVRSVTSTSSALTPTLRCIASILPDLTQTP